MPRYQGPFLGGSESKEGDRGARKDWAEPFAPEAEKRATAEQESANEAQSAPAGFEPTAAESDQPSSDSSVDAAPVGEEDYPEFLFGADSTGTGGTAEGPSAAGATERAGEVGLPAGSVERPGEKVRALSEGPMRDRIRRLTAELRHQPLEEAIAKAFAAGYVAAKGEEGS